MEITGFEKILRNNLSNKVVDRYTVIELCREAKIDRSSFYNHYQNICDLFGKVMVIQILRTLRSNHNESMAKMFYRMLEKIKENRFFYLNIILIAKDPRGFYEVLRKELAKAIEKYMRPRGSFSVRTIELVASGIYTIIFNWVLLECKYDIRDVFQCINLLLKQVERPKRNL